MFITLVLCVAISVVSANSSPKPGWVQTPHGLRPRKCVHTVEEAHHSLKQVVGGVEAHYPNSGRTVFHAEDSECVENMRLLKKQREEAKAKIEAGGDGVEETASGWLVYVMDSEYRDSDAVSEYKNDFGYYHSVYSLPSSSPAFSNQLLYFFTGFQNPDDDHEYSIIQPVVAFGYYGFLDAWSMASWSCCPSGQSWKSPTVGIPEGVEVDTYLSANRHNGDTTVINMAYGGQNATLRLFGDKRRWIEALCALETYRTSKCEQFNKKPFIMGLQTIKDVYGNRITPNWNKTNKLQQCNAKISYSQTEVGIKGRGN